MSVKGSGEAARCRHDASWCPRLWMNMFKCNCRFMPFILVCLASSTSRYKSELGLLGTDVEFRHQSPVLLDIFPEKPRSLFHAGGERLERLVLQVFPNCRHGQHLVDLEIETDDDRFWRPGRRECADPLVEHQS